jgi:hypothetical protein
MELTEEQIEQNYYRDHPDQAPEPDEAIQPGEPGDESSEAVEYREEDGMRFLGEGHYSFMVDRDYEASPEEAATLEGLASAAEAAGLPPSDWTELNSAFYKGLQDHDKDPLAFTAKQQARHTEAESFLKRTWGDSYESNLEAVRAKADELGIRSHLHTSGLGNDPAAIMTLHKLCRA